MSNRLGADIMIVPEGYDPHIDAVLFAGTPSTFYLPEYAIEELNNIKEDVGIASMSAQTFLATLRASCCSYPVQLVGIDYETDFIVKPWLKNTIKRRRNNYWLSCFRFTGRNNKDFWKRFNYCRKA